MRCAFALTGLSSCEKKAGESSESEEGGRADVEGACGKPSDPSPNPSFAVGSTSASATGRGASSPFRIKARSCPSSAARSWSSISLLEAQSASRASSADVTEMICSR